MSKTVYVYVGNKEKQFVSLLNNDRLGLGDLVLQTSCSFPGYVEIELCNSSSTTLSLLRSLPYVKSVLA